MSLDFRIYKINELDGPLAINLKYNKEQQCALQLQIMLLFNIKCFGYGLVTTLNYCVFVLL